MGDPSSARCKQFPPRTTDATRKSRCVPGPCETAFRLHTPVLGEGQGCSVLLQPKPTKENYMNRPSHIAYVVTETGTERDM
jgi:hypothetical protein